jgi:hypothetical protein
MTDSPLARCVTFQRTGTTLGVSEHSIFFSILLTSRSVPEAASN